MPEIKNHHSVVTPEEIAMLNGSRVKESPSGVDRGFRYRHMVMLPILLITVVRLLFFPDRLPVHFNLSACMGDMSGYFQLRGIFVFVMVVVYLLSYDKDWHYSRVAMILSSLAFSGLASDFFNIYQFSGEALTPVMLVLILARCIVVYCLFMNSIRDNRAPPMPRHIFS